MSEHTDNQSRDRSSQAQPIDLFDLFERILKAARRFWWLIILLTVVFAGIFYFRNLKNYRPTYTAEATLTISAASDSMLEGSGNHRNVSMAQQMGKVFPYIMTSGLLSDAVAEDLGMERVTSNISVQAVEDTNLVSIQVTDPDPQQAYKVLKSAIKEYPEVAMFVVGQTYVNVLDDSGVPQNTEERKVTIRSVEKGALLGFAISMLLVTFAAMMRRTIQSPNDFKTMLHTPCLGVVPSFYVKKRRVGQDKAVSLLSEHVPQDYLEEMRSLRTKVERAMRKHGEKTIMVTSSIPSEGKSTVASNLAISFAQRGNRVILVDCDLRHPSIQSHLDLEGSFPGIESVLRGESQLKDALCPVKTEGIDMKVLMGAKKATTSVEMFASEKMKELLQQLEEMADIVILDTSPSAVLADALILAKHVPLALYVVRYDYAKVRHVLEGIEELSETGTHVIGCVLNQGRGGSRVGYGYRYGGYGYRRYGYSRYGKYGKYGKYGGYSRSHYAPREENTD